MKLELELIERFEFTERQANAVLDLRLYQLTGLEHDKINEEYQDLLKKIEYYQAVLRAKRWCAISLEMNLPISKKP